MITTNPTVALRTCIAAMTPSTSQEQTAACILAEKAIRCRPIVFDNLLTAACLWEAVCDMESDGETRSAPSEGEARGEAIRVTRERIGSAELRSIVVGWTPDVEAAWLVAQEAGYDFPFDWEFVPGWIIRNIDWSDPRSPTVRPAPLPETAAPLEPVEAAAQMVDLVERLVRADIVPDAEAFAAAMRDAGDLLERLGIKVQPETPAPAPLEPPHDAASFLAWVAKHATGSEARNDDDDACEVVNDFIATARRLAAQEA